MKEAHVTFENLKRLRHLIREALTPKERHMDPKSNAKLAGIMKSLGLNPPGVKKASATVDRESLSAFVERTIGAELKPWQRELIDATAAKLEAGGKGLRVTVEARPLRALSQAELLEAQGFAKLKRPPARRGRVMSHGPHQTIVDEASFESWGPIPKVERITDPLEQLGEAARASRARVQTIFASPPCAHFSRKGKAPSFDVSQLDPATKIMILWDDPSGLPRAWATGAASALADVQRVAHGNLIAYVAKKKALGETLEASDFTERLELVTSKTLNGEG